MKKLFFSLILFLTGTVTLLSQTSKSFELNTGVVSQQTLKLYCENGVGIDIAGDFLMDKKLHVKLTYLSSRLGSALGSNAIKQDYYLLGFDWRFRSQRDFQIFAGLSTGYFMADYEESMFNVLPSSSVVIAPEVGLVYKFKIPISITATGGYNVINGDGFNHPGTLFPLYGRLSVLYDLGTFFGK